MMMKILKNKMDKAEISEMPVVAFGGRIIVVISESEAEKAVDYLLSQEVIGFDTETRPSFEKGKGMNKVALLQVSTLDTCFLFRLNRIGMPDCIIRLLSDKNVTKVGLSWNDDLAQLKRRKRFTPGTFVELQQMVKEFDIADMALQKLYANLFGGKISKAQRLTNWEADVLNEKQQIYAATDAWVCVRLYLELKRLKETGDYITYRVEDVDDEDLLA